MVGRKKSSLHKTVKFEVVNDQEKLKKKYFKIINRSKFR